MTRDEIYDHLAQVYLGKRDRVDEKKKRQLNVWLVINIVITALILTSTFYGLTAFLTKRNDFSRSGVIFALTVSDILGFINNSFGLNLFDAYFVNYLPSQLRLTDVVLITSASFVLSFLATIYPARRAAKIQPAQTLRYE